MAITPSDIELEVRREILEGLSAEGVNWYGNLNELDFLQSLYDLEQLPSDDPRFPNALGDFYQHRVNNPDDWDDGWIYSDKRFGLVDGKLELFLEFITKVVDPAVRQDEEESEGITKKINRSLRRIGYELVPGDWTYSGVKYAVQTLRSDTYLSRREIPSPTRYDNEIEQLEKLGWSQACYNFIVCANINHPFFHNLSGWGSFPLDRMFERTDGTLKSKFCENLADLTDLLALIVAEHSLGNPDQPAFVSRINQIERQDMNVRFHFDHLFGRFTSEEVFSSGLFDIFVSNSGIDETRRTHWAVKRGNLVASILQLLNQQPAEKCPKAFNVEPWPLTRLGHVAVMMPFDTAFDSVYEVVRAACKRLCLEPLRVDEIYGPTHIIDDVFRTIEQSQLVISDLTGRNPNVLYETGLAHARNRDVVMIVQNGEDIPVDLRHIRYVTYLPNEQGLEDLMTDLMKTIRASQD